MATKKKVTKKKSKKVQPKDYVEPAIVASVPKVSFIQSIINWFKSL